MINNRQQSGRRRGRGGQRQQGGRMDNGNRIDNRARGNAPQLLEKYKTLARDAQQAGDRVLTEYYLQFADHYFRVLSESRARYEENQAQHQGGRRPQGVGEGAVEDVSFDNDDAGDEEGFADDRETPFEGRPAMEGEPAERGEQRGEPRGERGERGRRPGRNDRGARGSERPERAARDDRADGDDAGRLDVAILPPAFGAASDSDAGAAEPADDAAPAPRRRGRPRRDSGEAAVAVDG